MLVLVAGDARIPERATRVPLPIQKLLTAGKIQKVVTTGNISDPATLEFLHKLTPQTPVLSVLGDADIPNQSSETSAVFKEGKFRIGVVSGFTVVPADDIDALAAVARKLDVDILLWGGSQVQGTQSWASHYFINPGSLTGAVSPWSTEPGADNAGFCLLDIKQDACTVYMYRLEGDDMKVNKAQLPYISRS